MPYKKKMFQKKRKKKKRKKRENAQLYNRNCQEKVKKDEKLYTPVYNLTHNNSLILSLNI